MLKLCDRFPYGRKSRWRIAIPDKILIIDGHPDREEARLCHALVKAYWKGCETGGHEVRHIKVSEINFPLLPTK